MRAGESWWSLFTVSYIRPLLESAYENQNEKVEFE